MFGFELGREFKLSLAEIFALFGNVKVVHIDEKVLLLEGVPPSVILAKANRMGGTIKIFEIQSENPLDTKISELGGAIKNYLLGMREGKLTYGINFFGKTTIDKKKFLMNLKQAFKQEGINSRFLNQNFQNLISAQILGEKLVQKGTDITIVVGKEKIWWGKTIWIQDINLYTKRDFGKDRDMKEIGMLPPKLAQIMINMSSDSRTGPGSNGALLQVYDSFVGLGTILIESMMMGNTHVYGSDYNPQMVESTKKNIVFIEETFNVKVEKSEIVLLDAQDIANSSILKNNSIDVIVTEGYLGELFTQKSISEDAIKEERRKLGLLYENFFAGLQTLRFRGVIVISFPFWEVRGKYIYFDEVYKIVEKYCTTEHILPYGIEYKHTRYGSLLYKRTNQLVGREVFKLTIK